MWVPKEAAVGVVWRRAIAQEAALVVAHLRAVGALLAVGQQGGRRGRGRRAGSWRGRGALLGAVVLAHQVLDAMLGRVVGQVAPAGPGGPAHAAVVGSQRRAELLFRSRVRGGGPKFRVAPEDLALQARCRRENKTQCEQKKLGEKLDTAAAPPWPFLNTQVCSVACSNLKLLYVSSVY